MTPTILVTDDQSDIGMVLRAILAAEGFDVVEAADGTSAREPSEQ